MTEVLFGKTNIVPDGASPKSLKGVVIGFSSNKLLGNVMNKLNPDRKDMVSDISSFTYL